jgi:hypothetical protein
MALERRRGVVQAARLARHQRGGHRRALPQLVVVGLGDRRPEAPPKLVLERHDLLALGLEAAALREVQLDLDQADEAQSARSTCSVS